MGFVEHIDEPERMRIVTKSELAMHSTLADNWMVVHDVVYDVSNLARPGGWRTVECNAGRDVSQELFEYHLEGT